MHKDQLSRYERGESIPRADIYEKIIRFQTPTIGRGLPPDEKPSFVSYHRGEYEPQSPEVRRLVEDFEEILETGSDDIIDALKGNIRAFLGVARAAKERRICPRVMLTVPVEFQIMDEPENHSGAVINGNHLGFLIQTSHDVPVGSRVHLNVTPPGKDSFRANGEILWKGKGQLGDPEIYQYGVKFLEVLDEGHAKLDTLINESRAKQAK